MAVSCSSLVLSRLIRVLARVGGHYTPDEKILSHIVELHALGWRVVELKPSFLDGEIALWYVTAKRVDFGASIRTTAAAPDVALAEIVRYASADAPAER